MNHIQPVGTGPLVQTSPVGELIPASLHLHQDGIFDSSLKNCNMGCMMVFNCMGLLLHQTVEEVGAG